LEATSAKVLTSRPQENPPFMIKFFQVVFLVAAIVVIVLNVIAYNKYIDGKKEGGRAHPIAWFNFILTTLVALGCSLNIIVQWLQRG
jgi:hypothetical protein